MSLESSEEIGDDEAVPYIPATLIKNTGVCTLKKCVNSIYQRLPKSEPPTSKQAEIWNVKSLPTDWVSVSKPSHVIEKLTQSRQERHEIIITNMIAQFEAINSDIESQFRSNAEVVKNDFTLTEMEAQKLINDINEDEFSVITKENFEEINKKVILLYEQYGIQLNTFYNFLHELEKARSEEYKTVLQNVYKALHEISYKLPYELQQYFEYEILSYNQTLLSNLRCYAELELNLNLQAENSCRLQLQKHDEIKSKWREFKKRHALILLNERILNQSNCETVMLETKKGKEASKRFNESEQSIGEVWKSISSFPVTSENVAEWSFEMQTKINELDNCARNLIDLYKLAIVNVFEGYFEDLQKLQKAMIESGFSDFVEINTLSVEVCKPAIDNFTHLFSGQLNSLQNLWESILLSVQEKLQSSFVFLHGAAHLWDSHYIRIEELQHLVLLDLQNLIESNDKACKNHEKFLSIDIDTLRQASTVAKLELTLAKIDQLLDDRNNLHSEHYTNEIKIIEKYKNFVATEIEVFVSELNLFLVSNPREATSTLQRQRASQIDNNTLTSQEPNEIKDRADSHTTVLSKQMKQSEYQVEAVHNWMIGLWEAIDLYHHNCKDEIIMQANTWVEGYSEKISKRYEFKKAFHANRHKRMRATVYDIRQFELTTHRERCARHIAGIENEIKLLRDSIMIYEKKFDDAIQEYTNELNNIELKRNKVSNIYIMKSFVCQLNHFTKLCNIKFQNISDEQKRHCNEKLFEIRQSTVNFTKQIKLFAEDGSFERDEGKTIIQNLKQLNKDVLKKYNLVLKDGQNKERRQFQQLEKLEKNIYFSFQSELEEFTFIEVVVDELKKLQVNIKTEVYNTKFLNKKLKNIFKNIEGKYLQNSNKKDLAEFEHDVDGMNSFLFEVSNHLHQTEPITNAIIKDCKTLDGLQDNINYQSILFQQEPIFEDQSFASKICCNIYKTVEFIQYKAKEFYRNHTNIKNTDKIHSSYNHFMNEVLQKVLLYHLQCELVWLNEVNEIVNVILAMYLFLENSYKNFILFQFNAYFEKLKQLEENIVLEITSTKTNQLEQLNKINKSLKLLYGCERNKHILEQFQREFETIVQEMRAVNVNELLHPQLENLEFEVEEIKIQLSDTCERLSIFTKETYEKLLTLPLLSQFQEKFQYLKNLLDEERKNDLDQDSSYQKYIRSLIISEEYEENNDKIKTLQTETLYANEQHKPKQDLYKDTILITKIEEEHSEYISKLNTIKNTWFDKMENLRIIFRENITTILNLYSVKYDN